MNALHLDNGSTEKGIDKVSNVNLVVPGPEQPFVEGIELTFRKIGICCFGPSPKAAIMEGSKTFSKNFMKRHNIFTANYEAKDFLELVTYNVVIKASGLAGDKGVLIPTDKQEALDALKTIMVDKVFGSAGNEVVIEEFLEDHKRIFDGPNTGGMGCYCPTPIATPELNAKLKNTIIKPTIDGMRRGEYNVRFGDPETEVALPLLSDDSDLAEIMLACAEGRSDSVQINTKPSFAAAVVIASGGYPVSYQKGKQIFIENIHSETLVFHAATSINDGQLVTSRWSRVCSKCIKMIQFENMIYRKDIVHRAFPYLSQKPAEMTYASVGGFGGIFDLKAAEFNDPILVATTDGVVTKLKIAQAVNIHNTMGIHSNGFSLVRKIIDKYNLGYESTCLWNSKREELLTPTKIYGLVKAMSHTTGRSFVDNIPNSLS
ncbi:5416_t:CDS:10 [Cetraspora pellucida]|uniref:5416_t:CDS:1 n=1 Tax=Cetraspora pellucida TaxID=1433469 RepID=A0A9N8W6Q8_9GLOM|nr:5416_t:CDS:10 [Cetraspora pellucida]